MVHHSCWSLVFQFWMIEVNRSSPQNPPQRPSKRSSANLRGRLSFVAIPSHGSMAWFTRKSLNSVNHLISPPNQIWQGPVKLFPPVLGIESTHWDQVYQVPGDQPMWPKGLMWNCDPMIPVNVAVRGGGGFWSLNKISSCSYYHQHISQRGWQILIPLWR